VSRRARSGSVRDEAGHNQGWSGGLATEIRAERRCDLLMGVMEPDPTKKVLEIGCGRGEIAHRLSDLTGMDVLGIDRSPLFVEEARRAAHDSAARFEAMDFMEPFGLQGQRFDYVVGNGILHHLYDGIDVALPAIGQLLKGGGRIAFLEPNLHNPYVFLIFRVPRLRRLARLEPDEMAFSRRFAISALTSAGFTDIEVAYRDFLLPGVPAWMIRPLVWIGAIAERTRGAKHLAQSLLITARVRPSS
jgi:SAM-dependent methyltransferase